MTARRSHASTRPFAFVALGDTPYTRKDEKSFRRLVRRIDRLRPRFAVHVGDCQRAGRPASADRARDLLQRFSGPVVFTPGDNDWVDVAGKRSARRKALARLRQELFAEDRSLGGRPIRVKRQLEDYPENQRFETGGVVFVSLHVTGRDARIRQSAERRARLEAAGAWLDEAFETAATRKSHGLVVLTHANLRYYAPASDRSGFDPLLCKLAERSRAFGRPVLVVQGDKHEFVVDHPPLPPAAPDGLPNLRRVQVMGGAGNVHAVRVAVDSRSPTLFDVEALLVDKNLSRRGRLYG